MVEERSSVERGPDRIWALGRVSKRRQQDLWCGKRRRQRFGEFIPTIFIGLEVLISVFLCFRKRERERERGDGCFNLTSFVSISVFPTIFLLLLCVYLLLFVDLRIRV